MSLPVSDEERAVITEAIQNAWAGHFEISLTRHPDLCIVGIYQRHVSDGIIATGTGPTWDEAVAEAVDYMANALMEWEHAQ